ncbi:MAG: riboflavin synthase [Gammaproteobacteria bacterium]
MFTGIIESVGRVAGIESQGNDLRLWIETGKLDLSDVMLGDSLATNGVCLTAVTLPGNGFWADVSGETLQHTTLGRLTIGDSVNLEKALTPASRLGGHMVSGHVDGVGKVVKRWTDGRSERFRLQAPVGLARYIASKGSVCIDGISLTVNKVEGVEFELNVVPHTLAETTIGVFQEGRQFNLEVDIIARYLERLLTGDHADQVSDTVDMDLLRRSGFLAKE